MRELKRESGVTRVKDKAAKKKVLGERASREMPGEKNLKNKKIKNKKKKK